MRDLSACFGEHAVQVADASSSSASSRTSNNSMAMQNLVTCLYQTMLSGESRLITVTWCKNLMGQGLSVNVDDPSCQCMCRVDMKSWFFWKKKGSKRFDLGTTTVDVFWDLSAAKYGSGPEPLEGYFLAVVSDQEVALLLGDMGKEAYKRTNATGPPGDTVLISRKEHVFGKNFYSTKAQFCDKGRAHDIVIECQTEGPREPRLSVRIDKQLVVQVKHLLWKFRGNQSILVDGLPVEMFWDVHDWFFSPSSGHAVFLFRTRLSNEEPWHKLNSHSFKQKESQAQGLGFSLLLYAWKNDSAGDCNGGFERCGSLAQIRPHDCARFSALVLCNNPAWANGARYAVGCVEPCRIARLGTLEVMYIFAVLTLVLYPLL